jgi:hypothetical protein
MVCLGERSSCRRRRIHLQLLFLLLWLDHFVVFFRSVDDVMTWKRKIQARNYYWNLLFFDTRRLSVWRLWQGTAHARTIAVEKDVLRSRIRSLRKISHTVYFVLQFLSSQRVLYTFWLIFWHRLPFLLECLELGTRVWRFKHFLVYHLAGCSFVTFVLVIALR